MSTNRSWWRSCKAGNQATIMLVGSYKSHSSDIVDVLNNVLDKGQTQFDDTRHSEASAAHNFAMLDSCGPAGKAEFRRRQRLRKQRKPISRRLRRVLQLWWHLRL